MDLSSIIKDPAQQLMQDDIPGLAALLKSRQGQMLLPILLGRRDADQTKFLDVLGGNNKDRLGFANRSADDAAAKVEMEHAASLMKAAPDLGKAGYDLNQLTPFMPWLRRGNNAGRVADTHLDATGAYTEAEEARGRHLDVQSGFVPSLGSGTRTPRFYNPANNPDNIGRGITANAKDGKVVETLDDQNKVILRQRTVPGGMQGNMPEPGMATPEAAVAPQAEQAIRNSNANLKASEIARLPNGKGFVAKYKSGGKDVVVIIPADANGRPLTNKMQVAQ